MSVIYDALKKLRRQGDGTPMAPTRDGGDKGKKRPNVLERNKVSVSITGLAVVGGALVVAGILGYEWWKMEKGRERAMAMARAQLAQQAQQQAQAQQDPAKPDDFTPPDQGMGTVAPAMPPPTNPPPMASSPAPEPPMEQAQPLRLATPDETAASAMENQPAAAQAPAPLVMADPSSAPLPPSEPVAMVPPGGEPEFQPPLLEEPPPRSDKKAMAKSGSTSRSDSGEEGAEDPEPPAGTSGEDARSRFQMARVRVVTRLQQAQSRGDVGEIETALDQLGSLLGEDDPHVLKARAYHFLIRGEFSRAEPLLRQVVNRNPNDVEAGLNLAAAEQGVGRMEEARARLEALLNRHPGHPALQPYRR